MMKIMILAITNEESPLPPLPMCLIAKSNKVSSGDDSRNDGNDLSPSDLSKLMNDYATIINKQKAKIKSLRMSMPNLALIMMNCLLSTIICIKNMMK